MNIVRDTYAVCWGDLRVLRRLWPQFLGTSLISPVLFLLAFGYGMGRELTVEGYPYLQFVVPGIIALTAMSVSFNGAGMKLNVDRLFYRSFDEVIMSPVGPTALVLGKSAVGVVRGITVSLVFTLVGVFAASLRVTWLFFVAMLLGCTLFALMGFLCAMYAKTHQGMATFSTLILTPMSFLGGTFFSLERVPVWTASLIRVLPLTHVSACLRAEALGQAFPWASFGTVLGLSLVLFGLAVRAVRRASV